MYSTCGRMPPWMDLPDAVYVRAAVVANNDLWGEALGADQTGKPVQKRRRIGGYGAGLSRHQKPNWACVRIQLSLWIMSCSLALHSRLSRSGEQL